MTVSELRRLKGLEAENAELKRLLADAMLNNAVLTGLLAKNSYRLPPDRDAAVAIRAVPRTVSSIASLFGSMAQATVAMSFSAHVTNSL